MKKKMAYEKPEMTQLQVSLESPICAGSVDITAQAPDGASNITAQEVNDNFNGDFSGSDWDTSSTNQ